MGKASRGWGWLLALAGVLGISGCGYNDFQRLDEQVKASWSEVLNQYQRRADLIPNIVNTVKGEAGFEQETLTKVIEARVVIDALLTRYIEALVYQGVAENMMAPVLSPTRDGC